MKLFFCVIKRKNPNERDSIIPGNGKFLSRSQKIYYFTPENLSEENGFDNYRACQVEVIRCRKKLSSAYYGVKNDYVVTTEMVNIITEET